MRPLDAYAVEVAADDVAENIEGNVSRVSERHIVGLSRGAVVVGPYVYRASNNVIRVNLISGNSQSGVVIDATGINDPIISAWAERTYNQVIGNFIGTNATGTALTSLPM